ncbi:MAG: hypothetical protein VYA34_01160 [Myxococcota bacterium]|nr:hypothetical protein [Myxococcota bacterium]
MAELRRPPIQPEYPPGRISTGTIIVTQALFSIMIIAGCYWISNERHSAPSDNVHNLKSIASKLKAAGATKEAAKLYSRYLELSEKEPNRANIAYSLGLIYLELAQPSQALRWFYEAETSNAGPLKNAISEKIVHILERLGKSHSARQRLSQTVGLAQPTQHSDGDLLLAKLGPTSIHQSDLDRYLNGLPPEISKQLAGDQNRRPLLQKYIADELVWQKAQKLEYPKRDDVRLALNHMQRQIVVGRFLEEEILKKVQTDTPDLKAFYELNKESYKAKDKILPFEEVRSKVENEYRVMKFKAIYEEMVSNEFKNGNIQIIEEALR